MEDHLLLEKKNGIATLILNRPKVHNVLTGAMYEGLTRYLYELDKDDETSVILIRGAGDKAFCAGSDVKDFLNINVLDRQKLFAKVAGLIQAPTRISKPVIAAIKGYALGGGCGIVAAVDFSIATENSVFGTPEIELGHFPMTITPAIIRRVGAHRALEITLMGEKLSAIRAAEIGLINRAVPEKDFEATVMRWATKLAAFAPLSARMGKTAFYNCMDMEYLKAVKFMGNMMAINASTEDDAEGISAFFEKRAPNWKGR